MWKELLLQKIGPKLAELVSKEENWKKIFLKTRLTPFAIVFVLWVFGSMTKTGHKTKRTNQIRQTRENQSVSYILYKYIDIYI